METYREKYCPEFPTRMDSFFISTERGVLYWLKQLFGQDVVKSKNLCIVKLKLTGDIYWFNSLHYDSVKPEKYWKECDKNIETSEELFVGEFVNFEDCTEHFSQLM